MAQVIPFGKREDPHGFCETPTATDILAVVMLTRQMRYMGAIVGAPGVGKTTTLRHYVDTNPGAYLCTMDPTCQSVAEMLRRVCRAMKIAADSHAKDNLERLENLVGEWDDFFDAHREPTLLIVDECQHLNDKCLDLLRSVHDQNGLAMLFVGNETLRTRFNRTRQAAFAQFTSRIGTRLEIDGTSSADVAALARHARVTDPKAVEYLEKRRGGIGGLRQPARLLELAQEIAGSSNVSVNHLKRAAAMLGGS